MIQNKLVTLSDLHHQTMEHVHANDLEDYTG